MKADKNVFPYHLKNWNGDSTVYTGLNARDYIAIQAMTGLNANPKLFQMSVEEITDLAYRQADAMIERSEER